MKKIYKLNNLDCANCAAKLEEAISKIKGINEATISFMTQKMTLEIDETRMEEILEEVKKVCHKIEPDCEMVEY